MPDNGGKISDTERVLCGVFEVLVDVIDREGASVKDCLLETVTKEALFVSGVKDNCLAPVLLLLNKLTPPKTVVDFVADRYLEIFKRSKSQGRLLCNSDALSAATKILPFGVSRGIVERIVEESAKMGWYGRLEDMTIRYLDRCPTTEEVTWLVDKYVNDTSSQGDRQEEILMGLANKSMDNEGVKKVSSRLREFRKTFHSLPY